MFSRTYSHQQKKELINALLNLTEVKFGSIFDDAIYLSLKKEKKFYVARMGLVENFYSDASLRKDKNERVIKEKIKRMI